MASTSYAATEEMTNLNRVSRLLIGPCTDQLRDLLRFYIPLASFLTVIQREKSRLPRLTGPQRNLILPNSGVYSGNYNDMDISLLYILLRNVCGIQAHNKGWGNIPDSTDRSVSANIERIRLARNECSHFAGGMCKTEFHRIWSNIKAAVVDLDKYLGVGNKFQEKVDFVRNDTMDPARDKHFSDQLLEQLKEIENIKKEVFSLKRQAEEEDKRHKQKMQKLESSQHEIKKMVLDLKIEYIPSNVKEQHKILLETWRKEDSPFHEIHSFPNILDKIQSQSITTIIGSPGTGKTTTARHLALRLQTDCEFEIVPVDDITEIKQYVHPKCKQLFILDDVIGVFGFDRKNLANLDKYSESILNVLSKHSKILFTCRKAVYNEAKILFTFKKQKYNRFADLKSFALAEEFIVDLEDIDNRLNYQDRSQMLKNHCIQTGLSLSQEELPNVLLTGGLMMYPLLCKLFCSESKYRASGKEFFEKPYTCILDQMDCLKGYKPIQYASLVLCMFCPNRISEGRFKKQDSRFMQIKKNVFENCRVSGSDREIMDALNSMINTFTTCTNEGYSLIHDSVYEVLAFHYGNKHQEDMLQYMSSSFVAKKFNVNDISDDPKKLQIKLNRTHYPAFAERLVRDLKCLELHDVFMNETLKEPCICNAFIDELKKLSYCEIKILFFIKQEDTSKIYLRKKEERKKGWKEGTDFQRQEILVGDTWGKPNIRVISWIIMYGHYQLLQFLFDLVTEQKESIRRVMDLEIPGERGGNYISDVEEQTRLLTLSCYNDNVELVKLILKHCDVDCIDKYFQLSDTPLVTACLVGHKPVVDLLIKYGAKYNQIGEYDESPLCAASRAGHLDVVDLLIKYGVSCNQIDICNASPLYAASQAGHGDVVDLLIKGGADCNQGNEEGKTPLHAASEAGHGDVVDLLINGGADCNQGDEEGKTPLHAASEAGHSDVVHLMIKVGADFNQGDEEGKTPLYAASQAGHRDIVDLLIKGGGDCNQGDEEGKTPLYAASEAGHGDLVDLLIRFGADCNKGDEECKTPLYAASEAGHRDVVDLLIKGGADSNQGDEEGKTSLYAASQAGHRDVVDLLIKGGADCNKGDKEGKTPLYAASQANYDNTMEFLLQFELKGSFYWSSNLLDDASLADNAEVVDLLIKGGTECNQGDKRDITPLNASSMVGHAEVVDLLIKGGADCNQGSEKGSTPLYAASEAGHANVVDLLIKGGADCNQGDENGRTPLYAASNADHADVVDLLIKCGADCNKSTTLGKTPHYIASMNGNADVVDVLIRYGADCNQSDKDGSTPLHVAAKADC